MFRVRVGRLVMHYESPQTGKSTQPCVCDKNGPKGVNNTLLKK